MELQPDLHLCKYLMEATARRGVYMQEQSQADNGGKLWEATRSITPSSPSREDPVLQAGGLTATPPPLVAAGTALVKRRARRWKRSDEQTAQRRCNNKSSK